MDGPLLIFLDDVHWADGGTVAALRALPPRLASLPIGWVLAMRPDQGPGQLRSVVEYLADEGAATLVLEPLSQAAVAQVASDAMQAEPDETLLRMAGEAGGNPFLLVELLEGLRQEELVRVESGRATLTDLRLPDRVRASMRERLSRMSKTARQTATVAGSLGRTFSVSDLATMLGLPPASLLTPVEELIEAGVVRELGDRLWMDMADEPQMVRIALADGLTNRDIADRLFVSPHTVNTHLRQVFAKLEVNSRVELTRLATERNSEEFTRVPPPAVAQPTRFG
jgi:hypothetical protein